jgi:glucosyl-dolichyl phosphate glucuronosyltransferase
MPAGMKLTICVCTHNRARYLRDCLFGLARQTVGQDGFAVVVVDSGATGDTPAELALLVAALPNATLIRVNQAGVSLARNVGAWACRTPYVAFIDDDAIPAEDWVARILAALAEATFPPAGLSGRVLPVWEAPLPAWWPPRLRGVSSIIDAEGQGESGARGLPADLAPCTVNLVVNVLSLLAVGGFSCGTDRYGTSLLSDEDLLLAWRLRQAGQSIRFDSRIVVRYRVQADRLTPAWLLSRVYWHGASTALTHQLLRHNVEIRRELPRRIAVAALCAPAGLLPRQSARLIGARWRLAYALGFIRAAFGWRANATAKHAGVTQRVRATVDF